MIESIWGALGKLQPGQAVVVTGFVGFLTLALGHILSAWLARRRDKALDSQQKRRVEQAFTAEITVLIAQLEWTREVLEVRPKGKGDWISLPRCRAYTPFRSELIKNLSLLRRDQIQKIANIYAKMDQFDANNEMYGVNHEDDEHHLPFRDLGSSIEVHLSEYGLKGVRERVMRMISDISTGLDGFEREHRIT